MSYTVKIFWMVLAVFVAHFAMIAWRDATSLELERVVRATPTPAPFGPPPLPFPSPVAIATPIPKGVPASPLISAPVTNTPGPVNNTRAAFSAPSPSSQSPTGDTVPTPGPGKHSLILEAQSVTNGGADTDQQANSAEYQAAQYLGGSGSVTAKVTTMKDTVDAANHTRIRLSVRNLGFKPDTLRLEWYFTAAPYGDTAWRASVRDLIFDHGAQDITIQPSQTEDFLFASKDVRLTTTRTTVVATSMNPEVDVTFGNGSNVLASRFQRGQVVKGWFVRLLDHDEVVAVKGSSGPYEEIAKASAQLLVMVKQSAPLPRRSSGR